MQKRSFSTGEVTRMGVLVAVLLIFGFTPLGYLRVGVVSITFNMIPVVIGAIVVGPAGGAVLGAVFGLTSFAQCFGADPFGATLLSLNPAATFAFCFFPRVAAGLLPGLAFQLARKRALRKPAGAALACLTGSVANTVLFISTLWALFGGSAAVQEALGRSFWAAFLLLTGTNAVIEAVVCVVVGSAVASVVLAVAKRPVARPAGTS